MKPPPGVKLKLHARLIGDYELLDYQPPRVIISRDGVGYVLNDKIFAWKFGEDLPKYYEDFEGPMRFKHEHPLTYLAGQMYISSFPFPISTQGALNFMMLLFPLLPGFPEFGAVPVERPTFEPDIAPEAPAEDLKGGAAVEPPAAGTAVARPGAPVAATEPFAILPDGTRIPPESHGGGYYGTNDEPPELVTTSGLPERGDDMRLLEHAEGNPNSGFRGTTIMASDPANEGGAAYWAGEGGWVYEIRGVPTWNVNKSLEGRVPTGGGTFRGNLMYGEGEYAIQARVTPDKIPRWGVVKRNARGWLFVDWHIETPK
jgi:hypothetical protein